VKGLPSTYVVGWVKRGPSGGIGTNRRDANETVGTLIADAVAGNLAKPTGDAKDFEKLVRRRSRHVIGSRGLAAIDKAEVTHGEEAGRTRLKFTTVDDLVSASRKLRLPFG
jgi:ferredoxin--NADP+ reductase